MELGRLHSVGFPARDDDDTTTRLVAVRVKGHVQEMESMGLDDQLDDQSEEGQMSLFLFSAIGGWIMVPITETKDTWSRPGWIQTIISVWDSLDWSL